jgi:N-acetylglutamate synthase-like GNAT family acetyltransferase
LGTQEVQRLRRLVGDRLFLAEVLELLGGTRRPARLVGEARVFVEEARRRPDGELDFPLTLELPGSEALNLRLVRLGGGPQERRRAAWVRQCLALPGARGALGPRSSPLQEPAWVVHAPPGHAMIPEILWTMEKRWARRDRARREATWIHLAWSALMAFFEAWDRLGRRFQLREPGPWRVAVPLHDYQEGPVILSPGPLEPFTTLTALLERTWRGLVGSVERDWPDLRGVVREEHLFSAFVEAVGLREGLPLLAGMLELELGDEHPWRGQLERFLEKVETEGLRPRRLALAIARYHRWLARNPTAALVARARTLQEIYETYDLQRVEEEYPETRLRLFRETVFSTARQELLETLDAWIREARRRPPRFSQLMRRITELDERLGLRDDEIYFLARLIHGHLGPSEEAGWVLLERAGRPQMELVVAHRDRSGRTVWIRPPARPSEILHLQDLFEESGLSVRFQPEHEYLLLVDEEESVVGGLYYREVSPDQLHMEKIVVAPSRRGQGLGHALMHAFFRMARDRGVRYVTTGFFRPDYFAQLGFATEEGFAGLVRKL